MTDVSKRILIECWFPLLSTPALRQLANAIQEKDPRLIHGTTTNALPVGDDKQLPCKGCCLLAFPGFLEMAQQCPSDDPPTIEMVEEYFARACAEVDARSGELAACRYLIHPWDGMSAGYTIDHQEQKDFEREVYHELQAELEKRLHAN